MPQGLVRCDQEDLIKHTLNKHISRGLEGGLTINVICKSARAS